MRRPPRVDFLSQGTPTTTIVAVTNMPPRTMKPEPDFKALVPNDYHDFLDIFKKPKPLVLPLRHYVDHAINLEPGAKTPFQPLFNTSEQNLQIICDYTEDMLKRGLIRESTSPARLTLFLVKRKDKIRPVVDYRVLNVMMICDRGPTPLTIETLN